jgi:deoxyribonuclease V
MILATDTHYTDTSARTAGIMFRGWTDEQPVSTHLVESSEVAAYEPGSFYKRELPLLLKLLETVTPEPSIIVIDGYVQLDESGRKGLGAHLFDAFGGRVPVIGVAKSAFKGSPHAVAILRGDSQRALFVTAVGIGQEEAAEWIRSMSGAHRQPTLLKQVDRLCRDGAG